MRKREACKYAEECKNLYEKSRLSVGAVTGEHIINALIYLSRSANGMEIVGAVKLLHILATISFHVEYNGLSVETVEHIEKIAKQPLEDSIELLDYIYYGYTERCRWRNRRIAG